MALNVAPRRLTLHEQEKQQSPHVTWRPGKMIAPAYLSLCAALVVFAPVWMTDRSFGGDWWLHLRLLDQQRIAWETMGHPTLFTSMDPVGALTPLPMLFGATLNAGGGALATVIGTLAAYVVMHLLVAWCAFFGMWWLSALIGLRSWRAYLPSVCLVTSAFFIGDPLGRGGFGEFAATQVLPLTTAAVVDVFVNHRIRVRSAAAVALTVPIALGGHSISAVWTVLLGVVSVLSLAIIARPVLQRPPRRSFLLLLACALCGAATTVWAMLPATLIAGQLNAGQASFDATASRYFGNPLIWANPLRILPAEHVRFWGQGVEGGGVFQGATSLFVQLPILFLVWALFVIVRNRRSPAARRDYTLSKSLLIPSGLVFALITFPELWSALPATLQASQYGFRLMSYAQILVAILLALAMHMLQEIQPLTRRQLPWRRSPLTIILLAIATITVGQALWQGWTTVSVTVNRGYDQPRQDALETPFDAIDWYDATQARAAGDISQPGFWTPTNNSGFTEQSMTSWSPAHQPGPGKSLVTKVVAPDSYVLWHDAVPVGRSPAGFTVIRTTGDQVNAQISYPWFVVLSAALSLLAVVLTPVVLMLAWREGRRGPGQARAPTRLAQSVLSDRSAATLAGVGLLGVVLAAVVPSAITVENYAWRMNTASAPTFVSATGMPQNTTVAVPCNAILSLPIGESVVLARTASPPNTALIVQAQSGRVAMGVAGRPDTWISVPVNQSGCVVTAAYRPDGQVMSLTAGADSVSKSLPVDPLNQSAINPVLAVPTSEAPAGLDVVMTVTTYPTLITSGAIRSAGLLVAIGCGLSLIVWGRRWVVKVHVLAGPLLHPVDAAVAGALAVGLFLIPPGFDDGWVLSTVRAREALGHFSNLFTGAGAVQPQGAWWNTLQATYSNSLFLSPVSILRVPEAICCLLAWILLRRIVSKCIGMPGRLALGMSAVVFGVGAVALLSGIRPEAIVSVLLVSQIVFLLSFRQSGSYFYLSLTWLMAGLAIAVHQSGLTLLATALVTVPQAARILRSSPRKLELILVMAPAAILPMAAVLLPGNLPQLTAGLSRFQLSPEYHQQLYEVDRWLELLGLGNNGVNPMRRLVPVLGVLVLIGAWVVRQRLNSDSRFLVVVFTLPWLGLTLTASKWTWHFGVTVASTTALVMLCLPTWRAALSRRTAQLCVVAAVALVGFNVSQGSLDWTQGFDAPVPIAGGFPFVGPLTLDSLWLWLLFLLASLVLVRRAKADWVPVAAVAAGVAVVTAGSVQPVIGDALSRSESWAGQQWSGLQGASCGLGDMPVPLKSARLTEFSNEASGIPTSTASALNLPLAPIDTTSYTSSAAGQAATPWFRVQPDDDLQGWIRADFAAAINATIEFNNAFGGRVDRLPVQRSDESFWTRWSAIAPEDARYVRVSWISSGETVSATEPLVVTEQVPASALFANAVWNNPQGYFQAACFPPIDISDGSVPPLDLSLGLPQWMGSAWGRVNIPVELACPGRSDALASNTCLYGYTGRPLSTKPVS